MSLYPARFGAFTLIPVGLFGLDIIGRCAFRVPLAGISESAHCKRLSGDGLLTLTYAYHGAV